MKKRLAVLATILLSTILAFPQAVPADTPASRDDVARLFRLMNVRQQTQKTLEAMFAQQRTLMRENLRKRHPELTEEQLSHMDSLLTDFSKDFPIDQMLDDMIPVYQKHLTRGDVDAMAAFYASPTGKKLLNDMPAIMAESMQAMMPHMQEAMEKMMDRLEKKAREGENSRPPTVKN